MPDGSILACYSNRILWDATSSRDAHLSNFLEEDVSCCWPSGSSELLELERVIHSVCVTPSLDVPFLIPNLAPKEDVRINKHCHTLTTLTNHLTYLTQPTSQHK